MLIQHLDPLASSLFSLLAIASLLLSFVMLGSRWLRKYLYAFAAESWVIAALSAVVGFYGDLSRTLSRRDSDPAVSRPSAALPDLADHPPARCGPRIPCDSSSRAPAWSSALSRHVRAGRLLPRGAASIISSSRSRCWR